MQQPLVAGLRWTAEQAGMAIVPGLAAACCSGSPPASSAPSTPADRPVALGKLVPCLHTHGERGTYLSHAPAHSRLTFSPRSGLIRGAEDGLSRSRARSGRTRK